MHVPEEAQLSPVAGDAADSVATMQHAARITARALGISKLRPISARERAHGKMSIRFDY